jgi:transposase
LRKGFDDPSALVTQSWAAISRRRLLRLRKSGRKRAKVLLWDGTGLCIYAKRLERGRCACLWREGMSGPRRLTMSELQLFLEGSALVGRVAPSPALFERATASRAQKIPARARG